MDKNYNIGLDFIRIFAMVAVILVHLTIYIPFPNSILPLFSWGSAGVQFFFVLSGFLAGHSFEKKVDEKAYYKKRAIRILPAYYIAVIGSILFRHLVLKDVTFDIFKIGWIRYVLGLNTILPSDNYYLWNNTYGLWTMSCFIWFYIMAPVIFKLIKTLKNSIRFLIFSFGISIIWKIVIYSIFSEISGIDSLNVLTGASPFGVLYQFAIGIVVYFVLKEKKNYLGITLLAIISICGLILNRYIFVWCAVCGLLIISFKNTEIYISAELKKVIQMIGRESFHVYLSHLLIFEIAKVGVINIIHEEGLLRYIVWMIISVICIIGLCYIMNLCERIVKIFFNK